LLNGFVKRIYGGMDTSRHARQRLHPPLERLAPNPKLKLMDQCREAMRFRRLALRTEEAYLQWIKRFILFHRDHPHLTPALTPASLHLKNGIPMPRAFAGCLSATTETQDMSTRLNS
jgi:hypothetical protein